MKKALICGVTGQDGAYLAEFLLKKGYQVHGVKRRASQFNTQRIDHLFVDIHHKSNFHLHYGDLTDSTNLIRLVEQVRPDEIYNLAAQSHVQVSFDSPEYTSNVDAMGTLRILEAIRICKLFDKTRFYQASTSELYGLAQETPQNEKTPFYPRSPYGVAKLYSYWITVNYREAYNMFACNGILFNHESPLRGETFVTRKIAMAAAKIKKNLQDVLYLGNLDAMRDWGHAKEYVQGMWMILQAEKPEDFVLATGVSTSVRTFVEMTFNAIDISIKWIGKPGSVDEIGINEKTGITLIKIDPRYLRPLEVDLLKGDPRYVEKKLGWKANITVKQLAEEMVQADLAILEQDNKKRRRVIRPQPEVCSFKENSTSVQT